MRRPPAWSGLVAGPLAWGLQTVFGYALVPWSCGHGIAATPMMAAAMTVLALGGAFLSWRSARGLEGAPRFVAVLSGGLAVLFALVVALQGIAFLYFDSCSR